VEAYPPSDSVTTVSVSVLVEPGPYGAVKLVASGDQIHAESEFSRLGLSCPQSSVEPARLNEAVNNVADACRVRGIVGYITVDFVTFVHSQSVSVVWPHFQTTTDLDCVMPGDKSNINEINSKQ